MHVITVRCRVIMEKQKDRPGIDVLDEQRANFTKLKCD